MARTEHRDADDPALTPAESLALIEATQHDTRRALGFSDWPFYLIWGLAWAVAFTVTHLVTAVDSLPLARIPEAVVGFVWLVCVGGAVVATGVVIARFSRGVAGTSARIGKRLAVYWSAAFMAAGQLGALLGLEGYQFGALFVFVVALLYLGQGAAFLDDLQLGVGVWLLVVDTVALALGPNWFNLVLAVFGAGAFLVVAAFGRRSEQRAGQRAGQ